MTQESHKILLIEDNEFDRESYSRYLGKENDLNLELFFAEDGEQGLEIYQRIKPDCILLDYNLPDFDGIEFLSRIQESTPQYSIPVVVMLTGQGTSRLAVQAMKRGAVDYIVKSELNPQVLSHAIKNALSINSAEKPSLPIFRILMIDDNPTDIDYYKRLLKESSYYRFVFFEADNAADGLEMFQEQQPDCILLDYNMPDLTGIEFLDTMKALLDEQGLSMPVVVMLTGEGTQAIAVQAMKRGVQDYLVKNELTSDVFNRAVTNAIEKQRLQVTLENKEREFEQFSYAASHDLQAPLRRISQFLTLLGEEDNQLTDASKTYLEFINENTTRLQSTIKDFLSYNRVGSNVEKYAEVDFDELLTGVLDLLSDSIEQNKIKVVANPLGRGLALQSLVFQLMQNLIENAIKYGGEGTEITVSALDTDKGLRLSFADNGYGIERRFFHSIFTPFFRGEEKHKTTSSGLGLAICKKIVELHHGNIWVESEIGIGTTFYVLIPQ